MATPAISVSSGYCDKGPQPRALHSIHFLSHGSMGLESGHGSPGAVARAPHQVASQLLAGLRSHLKTGQRGEEGSASQLTHVAVGRPQSLATGAFPGSLAMTWQPASLRAILGGGGGTPRTEAPL